LPLPSHNDKETVDPYTINVTNDGGNLTLTIFGTNQQPHVENHVSRTVKLEPHLYAGGALTFPLATVITPLKMHIFRCRTHRRDPQGLFYLVMYLDPM